MAAPRDKYEMIKVVGKGTFGVVWKARVKTTGQFVAIKEIKLVNSSDGVGVSAIDEIRLMQEVAHENILALHEVFPAREGTLSLVLDFIPMDLEMMIKATEPFIPAAEIKAYMKMLLAAIHFCHENFILHRDLKPANLLITADGVLKLCDFGLARTYGSPNAKYSPQAITIWYRPMELLLGAEQYGPACDMWGVGCIFAEMMLRNPLFATSHESTMDQIQQIIKLLGSPNDKNWPHMEHLPGPRMEHVPVKLKFKHKDPVPLKEVRVCRCHVASTVGTHLHQCTPRFSALSVHTNVPSAHTNVAHAHVSPAHSERSGETQAFRNLVHKHLRRLGTGVRV